MNAQPGSLMAVVPLVERLKRVALLWSESSGRTLGALATIVANHGSFFERLEQPGAGTTTASLEKFARFLIEPGNWPGGEVPDEVCRFAHAVGISGAACGLSPDIAAGIIDPAAEPFHSEGTGIAQFAGPSGRPPHPLRSQVDAGQPAAPALEQGLPPLDGADAAGDRLGGAQ